VKEIVCFAASPRHQPYRRPFGYPLAYEFLRESFDFLNKTRRADVYRHRFPQLFRGKHAASNACIKL
jgi:hypothetical protein